MVWQSLHLTLPPALTALGTGVSSGLDAVKAALDVLRVQSRAFSAFVRAQEGVPVNASLAALSAGIAAASSLLSGVADNAGVYVLLVPIPKKSLLAVVSQPDTPSEPGSNFVQFPTTNLLARLPAALAERLRSSPSFSSLFSETAVTVGGNPYFVKTVGESLYDAGDRNRPRFTADSYWAYTILMTGAYDLSVIVQAAAFFDRIFNRTVGAIGSSRQVSNVVPSTFRVGPSGRGNYPILEWETVPASRVLASFANARVTATEFAIIASTDFRAKTASTVDELFGTTTLTEGLTGVYGSRVIAVRAYDGILSRYLDERELPSGKSVYYHIAFKTRIENDPSASPKPPPGETDRRLGAPRPTEGAPVEVPYGPLSSCAEYPVRGQGEVRLSKAPDWARSPSLAQLIPGVDRLVDRATFALEELRSALARGTEGNNALLALLDQLADRLGTETDEVAVFLRRIQNAVSSVPTSGIYASVRTGQGDTGRFLGDLVDALDNESDENRPPFDVGDEFVTGVVLLTVGPDPSAIAAAFSAFGALFGPPSSSDALAGVTSVPASVLASLSDIEQALVDQIRGGGSSTPASPVTFGPDMASRPLGTPDASCE